MSTIAQDDVISVSFAQPPGGEYLPQNTAASLPPSVWSRNLCTKVKVLVADDEVVIANTLTLILNRSGFEARAVYSGRAAVEALPGFDPDVLISDVMMPGMTGIEAAIEIVQQRPECKVVLFSGAAGTWDMLGEARAQGHFFELLAKPVHPAILLGKLRAHDFR